MNSGTLAAEGAPDPAAQTEFQQQMQAWRKMLGRCSRKPGRKCVHSLRVSTLRVEAAIEYWLHERQPGALASRAAQRWRRQGKKLRRALGPVRQADVSLAKLERVRGLADPSAGGHPIFPGENLGALAEIERGVKRQREAATRKLAAEIEHRRKRLNRLSKKLEEMLDGFAPVWEGGAADEVLAQIAAVAADFPHLHHDNLHEFRKRIKKLRYIVEIFAPQHGGAARLAASLRRMAGAVGEWHDWQVLTEEASHSDGGETARTAVAEFLHAQAGRSLERALKLCRNSMARLLNANSKNDSRPASFLREAPLPLRKPVARVSNGVRPMQAERSARAS